MARRTDHTFGLHWLGAGMVAGITNSDEQNVTGYERLAYLCFGSDESRHPGVHE